MVDVRTSKRHHISDQAMLSVELLVVVQRNGRRVVPAKGFQRLLNELGRIGFAQAAVCFMLLDQRQGAGREDTAFAQHLTCELTQAVAFDQFQAQQ